jgi:ParB family chromosome partitioning protein
MKRKTAIQLVQLSKIFEDTNVRTNIDQQSLQELAYSIRQQGLLQPVTLHEQHEDHYTIIMGHRRVAAYRLLCDQESSKYNAIPAIIVLTLDSNTYTDMQIAENIQRENLSARDLCQFLEHLRSQGYTNTQIAAKLGKSHSYVRNLFMTLHSINSVQEIKDLVIHEEKISMSDIQEVRTLTPWRQIDLLKQRIEGTIPSVKDLREKVSQIKATESKGKKIEKKPLEYIQLKGETLVFRKSRLVLKNLSIGERQELCTLLKDIISKLQL